MVTRYISNNVHYRYARTLRIVEIGKTVGETWPTMEQCCRRLASDSRITIRRPGRNALKEGKHTAHPRNPIECSHEMHLAGTGIGKTCIDSTAGQGVHQAHGTRHRPILRQLHLVVPHPIVIGKFPYHFE
jgi:hypothetical protein